MAKANISENAVSPGLQQQIISIAENHGVEKLILFGSRARGDFKERSDIDLAFYGGDSSGFISDIDEEAMTLLSFDIVDLSQSVSEELMASIRNEGIILYEKI